MAGSGTSQRPKPRKRKLHPDWLDADYLPQDRFLESLVVTCAAMPPAQNQVQQTPALADNPFAYQAQRAGVQRVPAISATQQQYRHPPATSTAAATAAVPFPEVQLRQQPVTAPFPLFPSVALQPAVQQSSLLANHAINQKDQDVDKYKKFMDKVMAEKQEAVKIREEAVKMKSDAMQIKAGALKMVEETLVMRKQALDLQEKYVGMKDEADRRMELAYLAEQRAEKMKTSAVEAQQRAIELMTKAI